MKKKCFLLTMILSLVMVVGLGNMARGQGTCGGVCCTPYWYIVNNTSYPIPIIYSSPLGPCPFSVTYTLYPGDTAQPFCYTTDCGSECMQDVTIRLNSPDVNADYDILAPVSIGLLSTCPPPPAPGPYVYYYAPPNPIDNPNNLMIEACDCTFWQGCATSCQKIWHIKQVPPGGGCSYIGAWTCP